MGPNPCPICDSTENEKFSEESDWCVRCADATLLDQAEEWASDAKVTHEVI